MGFTQRILDIVVIGGITGLVVGVILLAARNLSPSVDSVLLLVLCMVFVLVAIVYMTKTKRPRRQ